MFDERFKQIAVPLILRLGLAVIFVFHGLDKIKESKGWGSDWHQSQQEAPPAALQMAVAWGELLGGIALGLGLLIRFAAVGIILIMIGAIVAVHGASGFSNQDGGFEYNFALIIMCLAVILLGSGPFSLDRCIFPSRTKV